MRLFSRVLVAMSFLPTSFVVAAADANRPNIVLLLADDLGWVDVSTPATNLGHPNTYAQTPAIARLATQGMSFTSMRMNPNCAPTRAAILTGQYAARNGVYAVGALDRGEGALVPVKQDGDHISHSAVTIAETLKAAGYATCHVAKYHIGGHSDVTAHDGFDVNYGGGKKGDSGSKGYFADKDSESPTGWSFKALGPEMAVFAAPYTEEYVEQNLKAYANSNDPSILAGTPKHLTDATADAAIDFMTRHAAGENKSKPFFMNVAFNAVHSTIRPRPDLLRKYESIQSKDPRHTRADVAALVEGLDQAVARILRHLDDRGLADNTLVIFTSDNGGSGAFTKNGPLRGVKGMYYEGGIRVPLIARLPGVIEANSATDANAYAADLYPTFAEFASAKLPDAGTHPLDGYSLAPLLRGKTAASPRAATYYHFPGYLDNRAFPVSVVIKRHTDGKDYKLIYSYEDQHYELFNLTDDLSEKGDLLKDGKPTGASFAVAGHLRDDLHRYLVGANVPLPTSPATKKPVSLPIPLADALAAGNRMTRTPTGGDGDPRIAE